MRTPATEPADAGRAALGEGAGAQRPPLIHTHKATRAALRGAAVIRAAMEKGADTSLQRNSELGEKP